MAVNRKKASVSWEIFANQDAKFYICTDVPSEKFFKSGELLILELWNKIENLVLEKETALEIGCGIGRLTIPLSKIFKQIYAVDISPTMLAKLKQECDKREILNITGVVPDGNWIQPDLYNFVMSVIVFQHIDDLMVIENYVRGAFKSLKKSGIAIFQFDTRPQNILYHARNIIPDRVLSQTHRKGIRRILKITQNIVEYVFQRGFLFSRKLEPKSYLINNSWIPK